ATIGDEVAVIIRTHDIDVSASPSELGETNVFAGTVTLAMFMGHYIEYVIAVKKVQLRVMAETKVRLHEGANVWVRLLPDKIMYFSEWAGSDRGRDISPLE